MIALPLTAHGQRIGLALLGHTSPLALGPDIVEPAELLAALAASCLETSRHLEQLEARAHVDLLTGLGNHAHFHDSLKDRDHHIAIAMLDVDGFKRVNDTNGHLVGDRLLRDTALAMRAAADSRVELFRVGGDEFAAVIRSADRNTADRLIGRVVSAARGVLHRCGADISAGVAVRRTYESTLDTLARADEELYAVKRAGHCRRPPPSPSPMLTTLG